MRVKGELERTELGVGLRGSRVTSMLSIAMRRCQGLRTNVAKVSMSGILALCRGCKVSPACLVANRDDVGSFGLSCCITGDAGRREGSFFSHILTCLSGLVEWVRILPASGPRGRRILYLVLQSIVATRRV